MTPSEYRAMARCLSIGWRRPDGTPHTDMVRAGKLGAAESVIAQAARDLESGWSPAEVAVYLRRTLAEIAMEAGEYVERKEAKAVEYEAKAREIESARRICVQYLNGSHEAEDETHAITATVGEFLASEGERRGLAFEDLADLEVGQRLRVDGAGNRPETYLPPCIVTRLADVEEKAA